MRALILPVFVVILAACSESRTSRPPGGTPSRGDSGTQTSSGADAGVAMDASVACEPAPCALGELRCDSDREQRCVSIAGCLGWQTIKACGGSETCRDTSCIPRNCGDGTILPCPEVGVCRSGQRTCVSGVWSTCAWQIGPSLEICDAKDNDCNGAVDDGISGRACPKQAGVCAGALERCAPQMGGLVCDDETYRATAAAAGKHYEATESLCDGEDNDCDGTPDPLGAVSCGTGEMCSAQARACICDGQHHQCGQSCAANDAVASCGTRCAPCPGDAHGQPSCIAGQCGLSCDSGWHLCGGVCADDHSVSSCGRSCQACPNDPHGSPTCDGTRCGIQCAPNYLECGGACAACPTQNVTATGCSGASCVATACSANAWPCASGCCSFTTETVDSNVSGYGRVSIAVDASSAPLIAYVHSASGSNSGGLYYATRASGTWTPHLVDAQGYRNAAIDLFGSEIRFAYQTYTMAESFQMKYAHLTAGGTPSIENTMGGGGCCDTLSLIGHDSSGTPLIMNNYDQSNNGGDLIFMRRGSGSWSFERPNLYHTSGSFFGFAVNAQGLAATVVASGGLIYSERGTPWSQTTVDPASGGGDLAFTASGVPVIVEVSGGAVLVWKKNGSSWQQTTVDTGQVYTPRLAIAPNGEWRVVYQRTSELVVALETPGGPVVRTVAPSTSGHSIAVDASGAPHIAWADSGGVLHYAH